MCEPLSPGITKNSVIPEMEKDRENFDNCFMNQYPQLDYPSCLNCSAKCLPAFVVGDIWTAIVSDKPKMSVLETRKINARKKHCPTSLQNQQPLLDNYSGNGRLPNPSISVPLTAEGSKKLEMSVENKSTIKVRKKLSLSYFPTGSECYIHYSSKALPDFVVSELYTSKESWHRVSPVDVEKLL